MRGKNGRGRGGDEEEWYNIINGIIIIVLLWYRNVYIAHAIIVITHRTMYSKCDCIIMMFV